MTYKHTNALRKILIITTNIYIIQDDKMNNSFNMHRNINLTGATFDSTEPDSKVDLVSHAFMLVQ
jgi:hypothetical protein